MGKIFKNLVISHTNDFPPDKNDKIKGWVENNGGIFAKDLTSDVTHLLTSLKSWKRYSPIVKEARHRRIWVLRLDWLEDSLVQSKPKRLQEFKYSYEQMKIKKVKRARRHAAAVSETGLKANLDEAETVLIDDKLAAKARKVEKAGVAFDKACKAFEEQMVKVGFNPYTDSNKSVYMISLVRRDILKCRLESHKLQVGSSAMPQSVSIIPGENVTIFRFPSPHPFSNQPVVCGGVRRTIQKHSCIRLQSPWAQSLQLYESNQEPHTYACITQYSQLTKTETMTLELAPPGSTWDFAWDMFRKFFQKKCGRSWTETIEEGYHEINLDGEQDDLFQCELPQSFKVPGGHQELRDPEQDIQNPIEADGTDFTKQIDTIKHDIETSEDCGVDDAQLP